MSDAVPLKKPRGEGLAIRRFQAAAGLLLGGATLINMDMC
jgi:hypothetical protein